MPSSLRLLTEMAANSLRFRDVCKQDILWMYVDLLFVLHEFFGDYTVRFS